MRQLLDEYLDNQLTPEARADVERRLAGEPSLARLLAVMQQERALRAAAYKSFEPDEKIAAELAARMFDDLQNPAPVGRVQFWIRRSAAAAAILVLVACSFYVGRTTAAARATEPQIVYSVMYYDDNGDVRHREFKTLSDANDFMALPDIKRGQPEVRVADADYLAHPGSF